MSANRLASLGLVGWDAYESVIVASVMAGSSLMFVGEPGSAKTVGAGAVARAFYGKDVRFMAYSCPELSRDSLAGQMDIGVLQRESKIEFIKDATTVWEQDVVLLDEPNRAPQYIQHLLLEFVRTHRFMGRPTRTKMVISAMNPPDLDPTAVYLSPALAQRYTYVWSPGVRELLSGEKFQSALFSDVEGSGAGELAPALSMGRRSVYDEGLLRQNMAEAIQHVIVTLMNTHKVASYSVRQAKHLRGMLEGLYALYLYDKSFDYISDPLQIGRVVHATVPEFYGALPFRGGSVRTGPVFADDSVLQSLGETIRDRAFPTLKYVHIDLPKVLRDGIRKARRPGFDAGAWAFEVLDTVAHSKREDLLPAYEDVQKVRNNEDLPTELRQTVNTRYRLRRFALTKPKRPLTLRDIEIIVRDGRRPIRTHPWAGYRVVCGAPTLQRAAAIWNSPAHSAGSSMSILPEVQEVEDAEELGAGSYDALILVPRAHNNASVPATRALWVFTNDGNPAQRIILFVDPSTSKYDTVVLKIVYLEGVGGRVMEPCVSYVTTEEYAAAGLRSVYEHGLTPVACVLNPSWADAEELRLTSALCHGMETTPRNLT